jgi:hypothetical protein
MLNFTYEDDISITIKNDYDAGYLELHRTRQQPALFPPAKTKMQHSIAKTHKK